MNVIDELKGSTVEEVRAYCQSRQNNASIAMFNVGYDFNIAAVIRNANFFGFKEVFHIQKEGRRIDKRGSLGSHHYTKVSHFYTPDDFFEYINDKYIPIAIENNTLFSIPIEQARWYDNACYLFGAENAGMSEAVVNKARQAIFIPGFGSMRSLNVGVTSGIIMSYHRRFLS